MRPSFWRAFVGPLCLAIAILGLLALCFRSSPETDRSNADAQARARAHAVTVAAQAVALGEARAALVQHTTETVRTLVRYSTIRDSLVITDTVTVKEFVAQADSLHRACTDLVESCAVFRVRAESSLAGLAVDRDLYKDLYTASQPSRWAPVREWAIRLGIGYVAFKLGQGVR